MLTVAKVISMASQALCRRHSSKVSVLLTAGLIFAQQAMAQDTTAPHLGAYGVTSTYCGKGAVPQNSKNIPLIGCFQLSAGHDAIGEFSGHTVKVTVDGAGDEVFAVDGALIGEMGGRPNLPFVRPAGGGAGYAICQNASSPSCPANITVFARNPDRSVLFVVAQCLPPTNHVCVTTQENWNYEKSRQR
jgi:hypothetical protein